MYKRENMFIIFSYQNVTSYIDSVNTITLPMRRDAREFRRLPNNESGG